MSRERATADNVLIGKERYQLYKEAYEWINVSIEKGFYLEAIAIIESLISDRLESRLSFLLDKNYGFKTLENLIRKSREIESDSTMKSLIGLKLFDWKNKRNKALHEMVKIEKGMSIDWKNRVEINKEAAITGLVLLRDIDKEVKRLQRASR